MLTLELKTSEFYFSDTCEFRNIEGGTLVLEHSLISVSKWESKHHKPFLTDEAKTNSEIRDYIICMTISNSVRPDLYLLINDEHIRQVNNYIADSMTATWFSDDKKRKGRHVSREIITSEVIYYWMIAQGIPFECQKWHLNRLITLIRVCSIKNEEREGKNKKAMSKSEIMKQNSSLNAARRAALHSKG